MTPSKIHNRSDCAARRRHLRRTLTAAEATLWGFLRNKQLEGRKFHRQHSVNRYILDFYCPSEMLAIELDGDHHFTDDGLKYDQKRTEYLNSLKIQVLRFENREIFNGLENVLLEIKKHFTRH